MRIGLKERMLMFLLSITMVTLLTGCKTKQITTTTEIPVYLPQTNNTYTSIKDTTYIHDSIYVNTYTKGDTVYKDKLVYKNIYKTHRDTLHVNDTIRVPVTVTKTETETVEVNKIYWYQQTLMYIGFFTILLLIGYLIKKKYFC